MQTKVIPIQTLFLRAGLLMILAMAALSGNARELPDFVSLSEQAKPAVVNISTEQSATRQSRSQLPPGAEVPDIFRRFFEGIPRGNPRGPAKQSLGSGFIVSEDGYILTNNHVIDGADKIIVRLNDRREFEAKLVGGDKRSDVAVLKIDADDLPVVKLGDSDDIKVGEWVLAIGSPFGFDYSVTKGIVSAIGRSLPSDNYVPFIQTDVAINPGNSGGPLFNLDGEVIGINSQIYTRSGGFMGVSFAIPVDVAMEVMGQIKDKGFVSRGWLGVVIQDVNKELAESFGLKKAHGALIAEVVDDGPAADSDLQPGDIILKFGNKKINLSSDLPPVVGRTRAGDTVPVQIVRNGKRKVIKVTVGALPATDEELAERTSPNQKEQETVNRLGMIVGDLSERLQAQTRLKSGVIVHEVSDGPAALAGIRRGDVITMLGNNRIKSVAQFEKVVKALPKNKTVPVRIVRRGRPTFLPLKITE